MSRVLFVAFLIGSALSVKIDSLSGISNDEADDMLLGIGSDCGCSREAFGDYEPTFLSRCNKYGRDEDWCIVTGGSKCEDAEPMREDPSRYWRKCGLAHALKPVTTVINDATRIVKESIKARGLVIYGNWCGPGYSGGNKEDRSGAPIDGLDLCCKKHDNCYYFQKNDLDCCCDRQVVECTSNPSVCDDAQDKELCERSRRRVNTTFKILPCRCGVNGPWFKGDKCKCAGDVTLGVQDRNNNIVRDVTSD